MREYLQDCDDTLPGNYCWELDLPQGSTCAQAITVQEVLDVTASLTERYPMFNGEPKPNPDDEIDLSGFIKLSQDAVRIIDKKGEILDSAVAIALFRHRESPAGLTRQTAEGPLTGVCAGQRPF